MEVIEAAREYWKRGWSPIPLLKDRKAPNLPKGHKFLDRWPRKEEVKAMYSWQGNVGIVCGEVSGICVLDIDDIELLNTLDVTIPPTFRVKTPRGMHYYFKYDARVKTAVAMLGKGIDIRSDGSYVVAPPSVVEGKPYEWELYDKLQDDAFIADPPEWMFASSRTDAYVVNEPTAISDYIQEGERDTKLTSAAGYLHTKFPNPDMVYIMIQALNDHYVRPPLSDSDIRRIVYGIKERYHSDNTTHNI